MASEDGDLTMHGGPITTIRKVKFKMENGNVSIAALRSWGELDM